MTSAVRLSALCLVVCAAALACSACTEDGAMGLDASVSDALPSWDARLDATLDARGLSDRGTYPDAPNDAPPEPPRTSPCEPRSAPIVCNPRRLEDDCAAFGEECTRTSQACLSRRPEGALCRGTTECEDGLVCNATLGYGLCVPTPGEGDPCTGVCLEPDRLFCDIEASPPVCAPRRSAGGRCAASASACIAGLYCSVEHICTEPGPIGAPCLSSAECAAGLACSEGACARAPSGAEECVDRCAPGLFCGYSMFPSVCEPRIAEGQPCVGFAVDPALECVDGLACYFDESSIGACARPVPLGGSCSTARDTCEVGSRCDGAVCALVAEPPGVPIGAPCDGARCVPSGFCGGVPSEAGLCWSSSCEGDVDA